MKRLSLLLLVASQALAGEPLKLWHAYRGGEEQAIEAAVKKFTEKTGVQVELLSVPYDAFSSKLTSAIPHDAGPDVFIFAHERLRQFHRLKVIAPSTSRLDRSRYIKSTVDALEVDGELYGYPLSLKTLALFLNTELVPDAPTTTDSCAARLVSVVPTQALILMNDEFVEDQAGFLAARVCEETGDDVSRNVERMFVRALSRVPDEQWLREAVEFVKSREEPHGRLAALTDLAHVIFNSSPFLYVE